MDSKEIKPVKPKGNQPEYSLEALMLKLKLQYLTIKPDEGETSWDIDFGTFKYELADMKKAGDGDEYETKNL